MGRWLTRRMRFRTLVIAALFSLLIPRASYATISQDWAIQASAVVQDSPAQITLNWPASTGTGSIYVYRKLDTDTTWASFLATLSSTATQYVDTTVSAGTAYEYLLFQTDATITSGRRGYVYSGIQIPLVESRGKIVLIVDSSFSSPLSTELSRLEQDLIGDGWTVLRHDVNRTDTVSSVKSLIQTDYTADTTNVKAVFLFGHVPVPYSGNLNPDGHADHQGAWPADVFYGEMTGTWTDTTVNTTTATDTRNRNTPGDLKYDQSTIPTTVELSVGRVDLANMPAFSLSEQELLRQYLNKDHDFRQKTTTAQARALVSDNFTSLAEGPAQTGWRFSALVGAANVSAGSWSTLTSNDYLLAYGTGPGTYTSASGIAATSDYAASTYRAMFQMLFGSYFGDWDNSNNFLRAPLCNPTYGLTSCWVARPHWFIHHMGLGKTIGHGMQLSTTSSLYYMSYSASQVHIALMGDPTLRLQYVLPPTAVSATPSGGNADLSWTASADTGILGYNVYRSALAGGPFAKLNGGSLVVGTAYSDTSPLGGSATYMIRAVRLEQSSSGTYYNASQGAFASYTSSGTPPPAPVITTDGGNGAGVDYTTNNASLTLAGTCDSSLVTIQVNGSTSGVTYSASLTTWSYSGTLSAGASLFSVTGTDAQPLTSSAHTITITLDTAAPTVSMSSVTASPTNTSPIPVTVTFSESVTGFTSGDISASNATVNGFAGSGASYSFNLTPSGQGTVTADIAAGVCVDVAGNSNTAAAQFSRTYDSVAPTVSMSSVAAATTNSNPIPVTVTSSEGVTGFTSGDITAGNATVSGFAGSGSSYTFNLIPTGQGVVTADIAGGVCVDAAGNGNTAATQFSRTYDSAPPTAAMSSPASSPTNTSPIPVTVTFNENVTGFTSGDISAGNASVSGFAGSGSSYSFNLTPTGQGAVTADIAGGVCTDTAGNGNGAAPQFSRTYDSVAPAVSMSSVTSSPTNTTPIPVTVTFGENVTGFTSGDITASNASVSGFSGSGLSYSFNLTPSGQGTVTADIAGGVCVDAAGNGNAAATQFTRTYDSAGPTVTLASGSSGSVNSAVTVTVTLSESSANLVSGDITPTNATVSGFSGSGVLYSFTLTPVSQGAFSAVIGVGVCTDTVGNPNSVSNTLGFTYDSVAPTIAIGAPSATITAAGPVSYTVTYGGADTVTLGTGNVTLNATGTAAATISVTGTGATSRTVTLTSITGDGTLGISIGAGSASDTAGNTAPSAGPSATFTVSSVSIAVNLSGPSASVTRGGPIDYTVTYDNAVSVTLNAGAVTLMTTGTAAATVSVTGSGTVTRTVILSSVTGDGTLGITIAAGTATDALSNSAPAAGPSSTVTVDNTAPAVAFSSGAPSITNASPIPVTVTFSESVTGFTSSDISVTNATLSGFTGSGASYSFNLAPSGQGVVTANIAGSVCADAAGNNNTAASQFSRTYDSVSPTVSMSSATSSTTNSNPIPVTVTFNETVSGFTSGDISVSNATLSGFTGSGASYSFNLIPSGQGVITANIAGAVCADAAGNSNTAAAQFSRTFDSVPPTVTMSSATSSSTNVSPIPVTVTFSESVAGFTSGDIGTTNATVNGFSGSGPSYSFSLTPSGQGVVTANIAGGVCADTAGNGNSAAAQFSRTYDSIAPAVSMSSIVSSPTDTSPIPVTVTFSENVTGLTSGDITPSNATVSGFTGSGASYSFNLTPIAQGAVTADIPGGACTDAAGNSNTAAAQFSRIYDTTPPTVSMSSVTSSATNASPIPVTVTFSESVSGFASSDIAPTNATVSGFAGSGASYSFNLTPSGQGLVTADIAGGICADLAGNSNTAAPQFSRTYDSVAPTVVIDSAAPDPTRVSPIPVTVTFSKSVSGFVAGDLAVTNGSVSGFTGGGASYSFDLFPSGQGSVTASIAAGTAQDAAGNGNTASALFNRSYDSTPPAISIGAPSVGMTAAGPVSYTVTYVGADSVTLATSDIALVVTGSASASVAVSGTGSSTRTVTLSSISGNGTLGISIIADTASDDAGNLAPAPTPSVAFTVDNTPPAVSLSSSAPSTTNTSPIPILITFSEPVTGFVAGDVAVTNGSVSGFTGSGASYAFSLLPSGQGLISVNIAGGVSKDLVGNDNTGAAPLTRTFDSIGPAIILSSGVSGTVNSALTVTATLSEASSNFAVGDITPVNATVSGFSGSGTSYSFTLTPTSQGLFSAVVGAGVCADAVGNVNTASNSLNLEFDSIPPTMAIGVPSASITANGPVSYLVTYGGAQSITLALGDVTLHSTGTATASISVSGTGSSSRTVTLSSISGDGALGISIGAGTAADSAGNLALAAGPSATFSVTSAAILVNVGAPSATLTRGGPVSFVVGYDNVTTISLNPGDVTLNTTGTASATVGVTGSGAASRTVTLSGISGDGTLGISLASGTATDALARSAPAAGPSATFAVDNTSPTVSMASGIPAATNASPIPVTVTFSEPVTGFTSGGVAAGNAIVTGFTGSGATYSFGLTPGGQGVVTANINAGAAHDAAGNGNVPAVQFSRTFDSVPPPQPIINTHGGASFTTNSSSLTLSGHTSADTQQILVNGSVVGVLYTPGDTTWKFSTGLSEGPNNFTVTAVDLVGNASSGTSITVTLNALKIVDFTPKTGLVLGGTVITADLNGLTNDVALLVDDVACDTIEKTATQLRVKTRSSRPGSFPVKVLDSVTGAVYTSTDKFTFTDDPFAPGVDQHPGVIEIAPSDGSGITLAMGSMPEDLSGHLQPLHYESPEGIVIDVPVEALPAGTTGAYLIARSSDTLGHLFSSASSPAGRAPQSPAIDLHLLIQIGKGASKEIYELGKSLQQPANIKFPVTIVATANNLSLGGMMTSLDSQLAPVLPNPTSLADLGQNYLVVSPSIVEFEVTDLMTFAVLGILDLEDIDSSGQVDAVDIQLVINAALGLDIQGLNADVNSDSHIDAVDIQTVVNAALGL